MSFKIKFWGVRGSIATPGTRHFVYGGNTSCVEVAIGGERVILDAGTGIRGLGCWMHRKEISHAHVLLSHTHWDHINGFPFFQPGFCESNHFTVMAGHLGRFGGIRNVLSAQMAQPVFPVPFDIMKASMSFEDFDAGDCFRLGRDIEVRTAPLNHPDGATGYRLSHGGKSFCYVTDTEHRPGRPDDNILGLIEGADLVVYDCTYTDDEFPDKVGWGHSTWQEGMRLCRAANARKLMIFHHDPDHDDAFMEQLELDARQAWEGNLVARENMHLTLD